MFKKLIIAAVAALVLAGSGFTALSVLGAPAQAAAVNTSPAAIVSNDPLPVTVNSALSDDEKQGLVFMIEEEKLARDVYTTLYAKWGQPVFQSIAASEQAHMNAIQTLLVRYGLTVPATTAGVFENDELQALYTDLVAQGSKSLAEALKVGATIEEVDIADLQEWLAKTTNPDLQRVYNNLLRGSYNHLRAFVSQYEAASGETYQPQILSAELYQTILGGSSGRNPGIGTASGRSAGSGYRGGR